MTLIYGKLIENIGDYKVFMPKFDRVVRTTTGEEIVGVPRWQSAKWHLAEVEGAKYVEEGYEKIRIDWDAYKEVERRFLRNLDRLIVAEELIGVHLDVFQAVDMINAAPEAFCDRFAVCAVAADSDYYVCMLEDDE